MQSDATQTLRLKRGWPVFWAVSAVSGAVVLARLLAIPADPKNSVLLGYSASRLAMMAVVLALTLVFAVLAFAAWGWSHWRERWLDGAIRSPRRFAILTAVFALLVPVIWGCVLGFRPPLEDAGYAYYERLRPLIVWLMFLCGQAALGLPLLRSGSGLAGLRDEKPAARTALLVWGIFLLVWGLVAWSKIGITPDEVAWGRPGIPVLFFQVLLAWLLGGLVLVFSARGAEGNGRRVWVDWALCLVLWAAAAWLWSEQPVQRSFFAPEGRAPNFEIYPYSDSGFYGYVAQSLLIGNGFLGKQVITRPLYVLFLAGLHALAGQDYEGVISLQTLVLALFPVVLYWLGKTLHSRAVGVMVAVLATARELNSFAATPLTAVSHSKLFLTDLPTAIAITLFAVLVVRWLKEPLRRRLDPLLVGGALGLILLLRTQTALLLPFVVLVALWVYRRRWWRWLEACILIALGMVLALYPWLYRNYQNTGQIMFDQPSNQTAILGQRYSLDVGGFPKRLPDESDAEYSDRMLAMARQFALEHPEQVAQFTTAHFLNNEISALIDLPMRFSFDDLSDTWVIDNLYWPALIERFSSTDGVVIAIHLALLALGIAALWRRWGLVGLVPLIFNLAYSLSNAVARNSGWRYILPVDWVAYFYYCAGLLQLAFWLLRLLGVAGPRFERMMASSARETDDAPTGPLPLGRAIAMGACFLLVGASLPLVERVVPARYPPQSAAALTAEFLARPELRNSTLDLPALERFAGMEGVVVLKGRALYPRFYPPIGGEPGSGWAAYKPYAYRSAARMGFLMVGPPYGVSQQVLVLDQAPKHFPNAADVLVIGCQEQGYVDVLAAIVLDGHADALTVRSLPAYQCPLK